MTPKRIKPVNEDDVPMPNGEIAGHVSAWVPQSVKDRLVVRSRMRGQTLGEYVRAVLTVYVNAMDHADGKGKR